MTNATDWRAIETAPKDGQYIVVFDPDTIDPQIWIVAWQPMEEFPDGGDWLTEDCTHICGATHWMPLPVVPRSA